MWEPAKSAIGDLVEIAPNAPEVSELIAAVSAGQARTAAPVHVDIPAPVLEPEVAAFAPETELEVPAITLPPKNLLCLRQKLKLLQPCCTLKKFRYLCRKLKLFQNHRLWLRRSR